MIICVIYPAKRKKKPSNGEILSASTFVKVILVHCNSFLLHFASLLSLPTCPCFFGVSLPTSLYKISFKKIRPGRNAILLIAYQAASYQ